MNQVTTAPQQEQQRHPLAQLRHDLKAAVPTFGLANEREQERMVSVLMVAVEKDPQLVFAERQSLIAATRQCANHGLVPDGNEATLQVYNTKVKDGNGNERWVKKVQYQPMVRGIVKRVLNSGKVLAFWAELVYDGEDFTIDTSHGDRRPIHNPDYFSRKGEIIGVYAVAKMSNGSIDCEPMPRSEIDKIRGIAKTKNVWDKWFEEKSKVAVMRRLSKRLPLSSEDMDFIMNAQEHDLEKAEAKDVTPEEKKTKNLAQRLQVQEPEQEEEPAIDGEIVPDAEMVPDTNSFEYAEGINDAAQGKPLKSCEHPEGSQERVDWVAGWNAAQSQGDAS